MSVNIDKILALPIKERRKISKEIIKSLPEYKKTANEELKLISELDKRWGLIKSGDVELISATQFKKNLKTKYGKLIN